MKQAIKNILTSLNALPDKEFKGRWDYIGWGELQGYIRERNAKANAPIRAKQEQAREKAFRREKELEKQILAWYRGKGKTWLRPDTRVKFKGTRDDGYRKILTFNGDQIVGFQFYYQRSLNKKTDRYERSNFVDQNTTTSNHVTNLRQVMVGDEWLPIRELIS